MRIVMLTKQLYLLLLLFFMFLGGPAMVSAETMKEFDGMEALLVGSVDSIDDSRTSVVIGDDRFDISSTIPIRYSNGNVASLYSLSLGQIVRVYTYPQLDEERWPPVVSGLEILLGR